MCMIDICLCHYKPKGAANQLLHGFDKPKWLEASRKQPIGLEHVLHMDATYIFFNRARGFTLDVEDADYKTCFFKSGGFAHHTNICPRHASHMHASLPEHPKR